MIDGNRLIITGGVALGFFLLTWGLTSYGILSVGPSSPIQSVLGSGVVAGLFSLISVTLSINQLISSRVFGALSALQDKLEAGNSLRNTVCELADHPSPPINTAGFISFIGETLQRQALALRGEYDHRDEEINERINSYVTDVTEYATDVQEISNGMPAEKVISTLAGPDFAYHLQKTDELRSKEHTLLTDSEHEKLDAIVTLLGILSVFRQYYKTIALHQELAQLSRQFIFVAFPAVAVALLAPLVYETNPACAHPEPARPRNEYQSDDRHRPASTRTGLYAPYRNDLPVHRHPVCSAGGMAVVPRTRLRGEERRGEEKGIFRRPDHRTIG